MSVCDEDVDLQSWGWTDLSSYSSAAWDSEEQQTAAMPRRSLRLDDGLLDRNLPRSSASFSVGGAGWRSSRSVMSRRSQQHSVSCSESQLLVDSPRKAPGPLLLSSSLHSAASDASLLSSLLDESSIQESTLVDTFWGLDQDLDPKESTIIAEQSTVLADATLVGSDGRSAKQPVRTLSRLYCDDCEPPSDGKESVPTYTSCSSSRYTTRSSKHTTCSSSVEPEASTIYSRDRSRKSRTAAGVLASVWRGAAARAVALLALLQHHLMLHKHQDVTDVLQLWLDRCVLLVRGAASCCASVLTRTWQVCRRPASEPPQAGDTHGARSGRSGAMNLTETTASRVELRPSRSLCKAAGDVCMCLSRWRRHVTTSFLLIRSPLRLVLAVLPLLLLLGLCCFGPAALRSALPAVSDWRPAVGRLSSFLFSQPAGGAAEEPSRELQPYEEPSFSRPPAGPPAGREDAAAESERLGALERSLAALWEQVEAGGRRAEQRHGELLHLYADLQQQLVAARSGEEPWLSGELDRRMEQLRARLEEERQHRGQPVVWRQQRRVSRLEQRLQALAARTEQVQQRREAAATVSPSAASLPAAVSVGVDRQSHDALLEEVARLEASLEDVRRDVEGLSACRDGCRRLDAIQQAISEQVSSQVREEVRTLVFGNQLAVAGGGGAGDGGGLPESLLRWLSQRFVSAADLQAALSSLELSILQDVSRQLEQRRSQEDVEEAALHAAGAAGTAVTQQDVQAIVTDALRLFSEDRTGRADYALESGGGSVLSTRCSETYETKAALLSLFGLPLWYFSQSPRAVIQPDVHPGNCWAFRGSTGFLVIRLSMRIRPTSFSLEHIPRALAPSGTLRSAPRDFSVHGLDDDGVERLKLLGSFTYDEDGEALQTFAVTVENDGAFQVIEVQVLSNWGHEEYTCMYRFRVHGTPAEA